MENLKECLWQLNLALLNRIPGTSGSRKMQHHVLSLLSFGSKSEPKGGGEPGEILQAPQEVSFKHSAVILATLQLRPQKTTGPPA